jgi:hypothetical protein
VFSTINTILIWPSASLASARQRITELTAQLRVSRNEDEELNATRKPLNDWCTWCTNPVVCSNRFLFVLTTGRAGSTSIMNTLSTLPGVSVSGENPALSALLKDAVAVFDGRTRINKPIRKKTHEQKGADENGRFDRNYPRDSDLFVKAFQETFLQLVPPPPSQFHTTRVYGDKEIITRITETVSYTQITHTHNTHTLSLTHTHTLRKHTIHAHTHTHTHLRDSTQKERVGGT